MNLQSAAYKKQASRESAESFPLQATSITGRSTKVEAPLHAILLDDQDRGSASPDVHTNLDCTVSVIDSLPALDAFIPEWKALLECGELSASFHQHPDVFRLMLEDDEPTLQPCVIVVRRRSRIECIAPCYLQNGRFQLMISVAAVASWRVRQLRIAGDEFICRSDGASTDVCIDAVFGALRAQAPPFDLIRVFNLAASGPVRKYFQSERPHAFVFVSSSGPEKVIQAQLGADYAAYLASLNGRVRQKLLRRTRDFSKHANGAVGLVAVTRPEQVRDFLADVDAVYSQTWQCKTYGVRNRNTPRDIAYYEAIAKKGWLRSYILRAPQPVAFVVGYQFAGTYHYEETGYDQRWTEWGPGAVLTHQLIEDLFQRDTPHTLDFGFGDAQYKRTLGNVEHDAYAGYFVLRNRWRGLLRAQQILNLVSGATRSALIRFRLDAHVRRIVKRRS